MSNQYIFSVARIRRKELELLDESFMEQLLAAPDEAACLKLLTEKGYGQQGQTAEEIFEEEDQKTWTLMAELVPDLTVFNVFRLQDDYHNLKAAIKETCTAGTHPGIYLSSGTIPYEFMETALAERDFKKFPEEMQEPAKRAMDVLLTTRDGQMCDCIVDRAALDAVYRAAKASEGEILPLYGELTVAAADIKIAVRGAKTGKSLSFLKEALAECDTLDCGRLSQAAAASVEEVISYLKNTDYASCADEIRRSTAALERWCDNLLIRRIRPQLRNPFGIDPLAAYILARSIESKSVRMILTGKRNDFTEEEIRGRIRETYV